MSKKINKNDVKDNIIENEIKYKENDIVLDKYSIIKELGSGGTSTVYLAKKIVENLDDNVNDELVAVKIMQKRDGKDDYD
jgi:serine/threonine protein kinase